ncbi:MAG: hypothetical protein MUO40_06780 [Anaerolineaceae bacterium]|nr:hypothetical protein [Anaerolineaceae bacterium]
MMNRKFFGIILISLSLLGLAGFALTTGIASDRGVNTADTQDQINPLSSNADPAGTQTTGTQVLPESQATGSTFSGEIVTCSNLQVIDLRLSNLIMENQLITVYPLSTTIELLTEPYNIKRKDLPLPYGVSTIRLVSSNGEELTLGVPSCEFGGGETGGNSRSSFSSSNGDSPPPPVPELSTMALTGIGVFGLIFIISRNKQ